MVKLRYTLGDFMAFDLKGLNAQSYSGEWIRFNVWNWHRIWRACKKLFPKETAGVVFWYSNLGETVSDLTAKTLAESIEQFGIEKFAREAVAEDVPDPQERLGERTIVTSLEIELPAFVAFLKDCGGFRIE
jgi:hypothetical protein